MKKIYRNILIGAGVTAAAVLVGPEIAHAADSFTSMEVGARRIHTKVVMVGKWVIIIKGSIDCIQSILNGDVGRAKQQFFGYLLCFGIMLALPWGLDEVEGLFQ
jgi:hypothetical protein